MTALLNIIFDDFGICLLGYRIKLSCLYIHYIIIYALLHKYVVAMK